MYGFLELLENIRYSFIARVGIGDGMLMVKNRFKLSSTFLKPQSPKDHYEDDDNDFEDDEDEIIEEEDDDIDDEEEDDEEDDEDL